MVQFVVESFGHLFVFSDYSYPRVYKDRLLVKEINQQYENFTSKGVLASEKLVYFTCAGEKLIYKIDEDLNHAPVPGTEGTSDFVVLKDERLFWITKSCQIAVEGKDPVFMISFTKDFRTH